MTVSYAPAIPSLACPACGRSGEQVWLEVSREGETETIGPCRACRKSPMQSIIHGSFLDADIPEFDVLLTDPPYSPHVHAGMASCAAHGKRKGVRQRDAGFASLGDPVRDGIAYLAGQARRWSVVYTDVQGIAAWEAAMVRHVRTVPIVSEPEWSGGGIIGAIPWVRWSMPQLSGDRPPSGCEMLVLSHAAGRMHWGGPGNLTHLAHKCLRGQDKHPTEKPLDQALDLVAWFSDPRELVLDPCAGRGTTALACALLGRSCLSFEIDTTEAERGQARLALWTEHRRLSERDTERWHRWAGADVEPQVCEFRFAKGEPV